MEDCNNIESLFRTLFSGFSITENDIIQDYIAGKINKDEYIKRMEKFRERSKNRL